MRDANRNMLWARCLVEELARSGVRHACLAPGSRSGPIVFALATQEGVRPWIHLDERSAGFFALGLAKAAREPVALVSTSGTAAANFLPAVVEARYGRVPLVVLTADRPHDLRDAGANQAIEQAGLYGRHVRWSADLPQPCAEERALRHLRGLACRAVAAARGPPAGPVHLNVPFPKPLEPTEAGDVPPDLAQRFPLAALGRGHGEPYVRAASAQHAPEPAGLDRAAALLEAPRGLLVAGPSEDPALPGAVAALARATGFPVLADPLSGLRFGPHADIALGAYDAVLQATRAREALEPQVVVRVGAAPTSDALLSWLEERRPLQVVVDDGPEWRDPLHLPGMRLEASPALACEAIAARLRGRRAGAEREAWASRWRGLETEAWGALDGVARSAFTEGAIAAATLDAAPRGATLFVSSSLPVRELDRFGKPDPKPLRVLANRGASGIDGVVSTALGARAAGAAPLLALVGDQAFLHDLPGLLALRRHGLDATLVVLNNDGGRVFERLPAARFEPPFRELFVAPHGLSMEPAARLAGARFTLVEGLKEYREELARSLGAPGAAVLEVRLDPAETLRVHEAARAAVARAVEARLRGPADAR